MIAVSAFAYNARPFAIVIFFLFLFLIPSAVFGRTVKRFLTNLLRLVTLEACDQDLTYSLDTSKNSPVKIVFEAIIGDASGTWHGLFTVTSIHSIQKSTKKLPEIQKLLHVKQYKNCSWITFVIVPSFILLLGDCGGNSYVPSTDKLVKINHGARLSYSRNSCTRSL